MMRSRCSIALATLLFFGCASMGTNFDFAAAERIQPGASKAEVIRQLGKPTGEGTTSDGQEVLVWLYSRKTIFGQERGKSVSFVFDRDGTLLHVAHLSREPI
jgi:hypothetical protein